MYIIRLTYVPYLLVPVGIRYTIRKRKKEKKAWTVNSKLWYDKLSATARLGSVLGSFFTSYDNFPSYHFQLLRSNLSSQVDGFL